jgi:hypothetical protein
MVAVMVETAHTSETSLYFETARLYIPDSCHLHTRRRENLKYHYIKTELTKIVRV